MPPSRPRHPIAPPPCSTLHHVHSSNTRGAALCHWEKHQKSRKVIFLPSHGIIACNAWPCFLITQQPSIQYTTRVLAFDVLYEPMSLQGLIWLWHWNFRLPRLVLAYTYFTLLQAVVSMKNESLSALDNTFLFIFLYIIFISYCTPREQTNCHCLLERNAWKSEFRDSVGKV